MRKSEQFRGSVRKEVESKIEIYDLLEKITYRNEGVLKYLLDHAVLEIANEKEKYEIMLKKHLYNVYRPPGEKLDEDAQNNLKEFVEKFYKNHYGEHFVEDDNLYTKEAVYKINSPKFSNLLQSVVGSSILIDGDYVQPNLGGKIYHATSIAKLSSIFKSGLRPRNDLRSGPEKGEPTVFLTENPDYGVNCGRRGIEDGKKSGIAILEMNEEKLKESGTDVFFVDDYGNKKAPGSVSKGRLQLGTHQVIPAELIGAIFVENIESVEAKNLKVSVPLFGFDKEHVNISIAEHKILEDY